MQLSTSDRIDGFAVRKEIGNVVGASARWADLVFGWLFGFSIKDRSSAVSSDTESRAVEEMVSRAQAMGADGVTNIKFRVILTVFPLVGVMAYGKAVKLATLPAGQGG